jgi:hypothetical protein
LQHGQSATLLALVESYEEEQNEAGMALARLAKLAAR